MRSEVLTIGLALAFVPGCISSDDDDDDGSPGSGADPNYCAAESSWSAQGSSLEEQVLVLVNQNRA